MVLLLLLLQVPSENASLEDSHDKLAVIIQAARSSIGSRRHRRQAESHTNRKKSRKEKKNRRRDQIGRSER